MLALISLFLFIGTFLKPLGLACEYCMCSILDWGTARKRQTDGFLQFGLNKRNKLYTKQVYVEIWLGIALGPCRIKVNVTVNVTVTKIRKQSFKSITRVRNEIFLTHFIQQDYIDTLLGIAFGRLGARSRSRSLLLKQKYGFQSITRVGNDILWNRLIPLG